MDERILQFIGALRAAGVRISLAESADAFKAIEGIGVKDRQLFRISLRSTLIKNAQHLQIFEEFFGIFFGNAEAPPMYNPSGELSPEEADHFAQAIQEFDQRLRDMLKRLAKGEMLSEIDLKHLSKMVGLTQAQDMRYHSWMVDRMKKALRFPQVQAALEALVKTLAEMGMDKQRVESLIQQMQSNQQALEQQLRLHAGNQITENIANQRKQPEGNDLLNRPFSSLTESERMQLRREVQRLAAMLRTRVALRQKRSRSGQLDAKATIRANLKHGSVPMEIKHRDRSLKPHLVVICDVSTSMRFCSELMLSLLYHMQDQISKTYAFAFIDHLEYISPHFRGRDSGEAVREVLRRMPSGHYNTDLGNSLVNFENQHLNTIDHRTTFILVGDGRNNFNDPRLDIFDRLVRRSKRTIWLNPEIPALWGSGDSDILQYAPKCDVILHAHNLVQLTAAIDKLLVP